MTKVIGSIRYKLVFLFFALFNAAFAFAQDDAGATGSASVSKTTTTSTSTDAAGGDWYAAPWVWVVGAIIFILLLAAIIRGNSSRAAGRTDVNKTTVTRTDVSSTDV